MTPLFDHSGAAGGGPAPGAPPVPRLGGVKSLIVSLAIVPALAVAGCGSSEEESSTAPAGTVASASAPSADFPSAKGKTIANIAPEGEGLVLAPSTSVMEPGPNRYGFAIFDTARKQISGAPVAIYISRKDGSGLKGPYVARSESLKVKPQFQSLTSSQDPDSAQSVYVSDVPVPRKGSYLAAAVVRLDGRNVVTSPFEFKAGASGTPPGPGEQAPKVHTPTLSDVAGDAARISTREPAAKSLLKDDFYDAYGKRPVALLFATPALCQSRVCAPVVDALAQAQAEDSSGNTVYIANEIYEENRVDRGLRSQPAAFRLPTEPWLFVIDANGKVVERIEGAFSVAELKRAVARAGG